MDTREKAIADAVERLQQPIPKDILIIQAVHAVKDIDHAQEVLMKRLRGWYELHAPEISFGCKDDERFAQQILHQEKDELLKQAGAAHDTGGSIGPADLAAIRGLARQVVACADERQQLIAYIETSMQEYCPNLLAMTTPVIGARLLAHAGHLSRLARLPGSAIQMLGAEEALFRHLHTKAKPPKYGVLYEHPLVNQASQPQKGKLARQIANKIAIAVKADVYGDRVDVGKEIYEELEAKHGRA